MDVDNGWVRRGRGRETGLTLIELLVVISIIALLAAMLTPAFKAVRATAKTIDCGSRMQQIHLSFQSYLTDNRGRYPWGWSNLTANWMTWSRAITNQPEGTVGAASYQQTGAAQVAKMFYCSEDRLRPDMTMSSFGSPSDQRLVWDLFVSHGYNGHVIGGQSTYADTQRPLHSTGIAKPDETVLCADSINRYSDAQSAIAKGYQPGHGLVGANGAPPAYPRHKGGTVCSVLWVDGHASTVRAAGPGDSGSLYLPRVLGQTNYWDKNLKRFINSPYDSVSCWDNQ
jgi:prepilin-type N-terminal cleavage/methylation domain-containing protein/prepilin-type processing-associated H-X9-DG protein